MFEFILINNLHLRISRCQSYILLKFPRIIFKSAIFPYSVGHCALLAPVVSVRPQEFIKLTLAPRKCSEFFILGLHVLPLTLALFHVFEVEM